MENYYDTNLLKHSIKTLFSNKIRFFLTLIGVIVGVVLFTFTIINFDNNYQMINKKYEQFGDDTIVLSGQFSLEEFMNISEWDHVNNVIYYNKQLQATPVDTSNVTSYITGVSDEFLEMPLPTAKSPMSVYYSNLIYGRNFNNEELLGLSNVAIINESTAMLFFGKRNAVGEEITLTVNNKLVNFYIVGIIEDSFANLKAFDDLQKKTDEEDPYVKYLTDFYVPQAIYNRYSNESSVIDKIVITDSGLDVSNLNAITFEYYDIFTHVDINTSALERQQQISEFNSYKNLYLALSVLFVLLSCLILSVVMLFSIKERVYEIGLKKALGAKNMDIIFQFMSEFIIVGFLGSALGVIFGILCFCINSIFANQGALYFYVFPSIYALIAPFFIMMFLITLFSIIPAIIAGKVNIIDAIRFE